MYYIPKAISNTITNFDRITYEGRIFDKAANALNEFQSI